MIENVFLEEIYIKNLFEKKIDLITYEPFLKTLII